MPVLTDWCITEVDGSGPRLLGKVTGHPRIIDGHRCSTSVIVWMNEERTMARTKTGTEYFLVNPMPDAVQDWLDAHKPKVEVLLALGIDPKMLLGEH